MTTRTALQAWTKMRNEAPEEDLFRADAEGAAACGAHSLAALLRLRGALDAVRMDSRIVTLDDVAAHLDEAIALARGEARERLRERLADPFADVPGIVAEPLHA